MILVFLPSAYFATHMALGHVKIQSSQKWISLLMYFGLYVTERFIVQKLLVESHEFSSAQSSVAVSVIIYILLRSLSP